MEYLKEILAFEKWLETNPNVTPMAQLLWYKLMGVNNKCYWQEWFQCANTRLMGMMNISSDKTLAAARAVLVENKRIIYHEGSNRKIAGRYSMVSLVSTVKNTVEQEVIEPTIAVSTVNNTVEVGALIDIDKTKDTNQLVLELEDGSVDIRQILDYYLYAASKDLESNGDRITALDLISQPGMTFEYIKNGIDKSKQSYKKRYKGDRMPFGYCKPSIFDFYITAVERSKLNGTVERDISSNSGESQTGQTGNKATRADERTTKLIDVKRDTKIGDTDCNY